MQDKKKDFTPIKLVDFDYNLFINVEPKILKLDNMEMALDHESSKRMNFKKYFSLKSETLYFVVF